MAKKIQTEASIPQINVWFDPMTDQGSKLGIRRLESKRTFVAGRLTGTAVWDPRSLEREEGEIVCATVYDAPRQVLLPRSVHLLIFYTFSCATVSRSNVLVKKV